MLESAHAVVVLLTPRFHKRLLVLGLEGGDSSDVVVTPDGAMIVDPGVRVTGLHCIESGMDLTLDEDYAVFHTGKPAEFVERFVPVLRAAIEKLGWARVRDSLNEFLKSSG
jgi:hypothetical protein